MGLKQNITNWDMVAASHFAFLLMFILKTIGERKVGQTLKKLASFATFRRYRSKYFLLFSWARELWLHAKQKINHTVDSSCISMENPPIGSISLYKEQKRKEEK
jgi:hypothetical protein